MAEINQFGSARPGFSPDCQRCERQLTDAIDGTLSPEEQRSFDQHLASCPACQHTLAEARRGLAWLELLHADRPEPASDLVDRILRQTSGSGPALALPSALSGDQTLPLVAASVAPEGTLAFPHRFEPRRPSFGALLQTRVAMTAAMAFFSVTLTLNLVGVRVSELRPGDLRPANLRREVFALNAYVLRYYESLRVVYELESRVHDLQHATDTDSSTAQPAVTTPAPAAPQLKPEHQKPPAPQPHPSAEDRSRSSFTSPHAPAPAGTLPASSSPNKRSLLLPMASPGSITPVTLHFTLHPRQIGLRA